MVAVVSGSGLGLFNSSLSLLGSGGATGTTGQQSRSGERIYVNSVTGNLVVQSRDEVLTATGLDLALVRTYNSRGLLNDDNGDNWRMSVHRRVFNLTGTVNTAGSTITKTFGDGADIVYTYNAGVYVSTDGDGAHDTLSWSAGTSLWTWTDGSGRNTETYNASGVLQNTRDADGNQATYFYTGNNVRILDASGQEMFLDYTGNNLTQVRVVISGVTQTITRYTYDGQNRLSQVRVDLTPTDNSITDNIVFLTTYTYDGTSTRIASITQGSNSVAGSTVNFTYENVEGVYRLKTFVDGEGKVTTFTYTAAGATVANANPALPTTETTQTPYNLNTGALTVPTTGWTTPTALESSSNAVSQLTAARANSGNAVAAWVQGGQVFARVYNDTTQTWASAVTLSGASATITALQLNVDVASGNAIVTWIAGGNNARVNRYVSGAWTTNDSLVTVSGLSDVTGSINANGQAAVSWLETSGSNRTIKIRRRPSSTWVAAENVLSPVAAAVTAPKVSVLSNNTVQVVWRRNNAGVERLYTRGYNGSWSSTPQISVSNSTNVGLFSSDKDGTTSHAAWVQGNNLYRNSGSVGTWGTATLVTATSSAITGFAFATGNYSNTPAAFTTADGNIWAKRVGASAEQIGTAAGATNLTVYSGTGGVVMVSWRASGVLNATTFNGTSWSTPATIPEATPLSPLFVFLKPNATTLLSDQALAVFAMNDGTANSTFFMRYLLAGYVVQAGDTWASVSTLLYGSTAVQTQLRAAVGAAGVPDPPTVGSKLTGLPGTITVETVTTVPPYYIVQSGDTWTSITQNVYGTSAPAAVAALQAALGNPPLPTAGTHLPMPASITYGNSGPSIQTDISSPRGFQTRMTNDSSGRLTAMLSPTVNGMRLETRFAYDADGNVTTITEDPTGANRVTTNTYDARGNLTLTRDSLGNTATRIYSPTTNQLVNETAYVVPDPDGAGAGQPTVPMTTRYAYDSEQHLRFVVSAEGRVTEHRYDAAGNLTATIRYVGGQYSVSGLPPTTELSESQLTTWAGTQNLQQIERTNYAYDPRGNLMTATAFASTDAAGVGIAAGSSITRYVYDQRGRLLSQIDPRGEGTPANDYVTTFTYDGLGRVLTAVRWTAAGNVPTAVTTYNDGTRTNTVTLANGLVTTTVFDRVGRVLTVSAAASQALGTTTYTYDDDGRLRMVTDPIGVRTFHVYDAAGRKIFTVDGDGSLTELIYDRLSNVVKTVEYAVAANTALLHTGGVPIVNVDIAALRASANGQSTYNRISRAVYDASHRVVYTIDAGGNLARNFYDGASRVTDTLRYATPVTVSASIDELVFNGTGITGVTITTSPDDRLSRSFYDNEGRITGALDGAGYLVKYLYNGAGELVQTTAYSDDTDPALRTTGTLAQLEASITASSTQDVISYFYYDGQGRRIGQARRFVELGAQKFYFTEWRYDAAGNVSQEIRYPSAIVFAGTPTFANLLPGSTTGAHVTSYEYDEQNRVTRETNFEGTITELKYDNVGNLIKTTRALGVDPRVTQTRYDELGRVKAELTAEGSVALAALGGSPTQQDIDNVWAQYGVAYAYDLAGRRISSTDQYGHATLFFYDADARLRFTTRLVESGEAEVAELRYNALGQVASRHAYANRILSSGLVGGDVTATLMNRVNVAADSMKDLATTYTYRLTGQVATETTAEGGVTTNVYNTFGEVFTSTQLIEGATSIEHRYTYDRRGSLALTRWDPNGLNTTEARQYDAFGRVKQITDARNNTRTVNYDQLGRTVQVTDALLKNTITTYDAFSRVLSVSDRLTNLTQYAYNDTNRSVVVTTPENIQITTVHNVHGETATITDARGTVTTYEYDVNGQLKRVFDPLFPTLGNLSEQTYDRAGLPVDSKDANGVITRVTYDAANRVFKRTVDPTAVNPTGLNLVTTYQYDGRGQSISTTDERGVTTVTAYTPDGRVESVTTQMTATPDLVTSFTYDKRGSLRVTTEANGTNPHTVTYEYDVLGRRSREIVVIGNGDPDAITLYRYDGNGNLTRKIDAKGYSTWFVYDQLDRLRYTIDALGGVTQNKYDDEGRVTETRRHALPPSNVTYASPDIVASVTINEDNADRVEQRVYDRDGRMAYKLDIVDTASGVGHAVVTAYTYDGNGNVTRQRVYANTAAPSVPRTMAGLAGVAINTTLDRESATVYDIRNRAEIAIEADGSVTRYKYDGNGNVTEQTEYAASVPAAGALRLSYVAGTNNSADRFLGRFKTGDVVTATVRFKAPANAAGTIFLGDVGGPVAYDNDTQLSLPGNDGWRTLTVTWTMLSDDDMWVYVYGHANNPVIYDNVVVTSTQRGTVLDDKFETGIAPWTISGTAQAVTVSLLDIGSDSAIRAFVDTLANVSRDRTTRYWHDAENRQRFVLDAEGYLTETRYADATRTEERFGYLAKPTTITPASTLANVATAADLIDDVNVDRYTKTEFDKAGRAVKITNDAIAGTYEAFVYDQVGNLKSYRNQKGDIWEYDYDANRRRIEERSPQVSITHVDFIGGVVTPATVSAKITTRIAYDELGNVKSRTEAFGRPEARITTYAYDQLGRQTRTTFPQIKVYNAAQDNPALAGANVVRVEQTIAEPYSEVTYNVFGDAVVNRDVAANYSHKAYDRLGRVVYEIDPVASDEATQGYVTKHVYDPFGNETSLTRYANAVNVNTAPALTLSAAWTAAQIEGHFTTNAADRTVTTQYDRLNRVVQVTQPSTQTFIMGVGQPIAGATTSYTYNAFDEVVLERQLVDSINLKYADTYRYYDRRGLLTATVDPLGYLTVMEYATNAGELTHQTEYAAPLAWWNASGYASPAQAIENPNDIVANGVVMTGDSATKVGGSDGWGNASFRSKVGYKGGASVSFTVPQTNRYLMVGLNSDPMSNNSYDTIDYALYATNNGTLQIYENGAQRESAPGNVSFGNYVAGDSFSVVYDGTRVVYYKNGTVLREVAAATGLTLYADSSFYTVGGRVDNIAFRDIEAQQEWIAEGVTVHGGTARKESGTAEGWGTSAFRSKVGYTGGATVSFTVSQNNRYLMVGLNSDPASNTSYETIDFAIYPTATGAINIYENGTGYGGFGTYAEGDRFRVTYDGAKVVYERNGVVLREVVTAITGPLYADSAFYSAGGEVTDIEFHTRGDGEDRDIVYTYDRLGRIATESKKLADEGGLARDRVVTTYGYDAVGNRTSITDHAGAATYTYYDKLGRVKAMAEPQRDVDGSAATTLVTPLTEMARDAHGNLTRQIVYADGATNANSADYTAPTLPAPKDRTTLIQVDSYGHAIRTLDAEGALREASYTVRGEVAKEWQLVVNNNSTPSITDAIVTIYQYDKVGREKAIIEPARLDSITQIVTTSVVYNAFGEITSKLVSGGTETQAEYFDYDGAGRVWRTNAEDGVDKVFAYDLLGNRTAEIKSQSVNLKTGVNNVGEALALTGGQRMRVETRYDLRGNAVEQRDTTFGARPTEQAIATPLSQSGSYLVWTAPAENGVTATFEYGVTAALGSTLTIEPLSGQLRVNVASLNGNFYYKVSYRRFGDPSAFAIATGTFSVTNSNVTTVSPQIGADVGGITVHSASPSGTSVTVSWAQATGGYNPSMTAILELKRTTETSWQAASGTYSAATGRYSAALGVTTGDYHYRITHLLNGVTQYMGTGTMTVGTTGALSPSFSWGNAIGALGASASSTYIGNASVTLSWPATGEEEHFLYRPPGVTPMTSVPVVVSGGIATVTLGEQPTGFHEWYHEYGSYQEVWSPYGSTYQFVATGVSDGRFFVDGPSAPTPATVDHNYYGNGVAPIYSATQPSIVTTTFFWPIDSSIYGSPTFGYRLVGAQTYTYPVVANNGSVYYASVANLSGNYEWLIEYRGPPNSAFPYESPVTAWATGAFQVSGTNVSVNGQIGSPTWLSVARVGDQLRWTGALPGGDTLQVRLYDRSTGALAYTLTPALISGADYYASFYGKSPGGYAYEVAYIRAGNAYLLGSGNLDIANTASPSAATSVSGFSGFTDAGNGRVAWTPAPTSGTDVVLFRYRAAGNPQWSTRTAFPYQAGYAVDLLGVISGPIEYEVHYTSSTGHSPYRIGKGTANLVTTPTTSATVTDTTTATLQPVSATPRLQQAFDRWGQVVRSTDAALQSTHYRYNQLGQVTEVRLPRTTIVSTKGPISTTVVTPTQRNYYDRLGRTVATRDANGNLNRVEYNAGSQAVAETHADGTTQSFVYDAFGQQIQATDELGFRGRMRYDRAGNLTAHAREVELSQFATATPSDLTALDPAKVVQIDYAYDAAGRRIAETSGEAAQTFPVTMETTRYWYDLRGNIIRRRTPLGFETTYQYDVYGNKKHELNPNNDSQSWTYDAFGHALTYTNMAGRTTNYFYDAESKLLDYQTVNVTSNGQQYNNFQYINYEYDEAGHLISIAEDSDDQSVLNGGVPRQNVLRTTEYSYDAAGRRSRERVTVDNLLHKDARIQYDELGRLKGVADLQYKTTHNYDAVGNRTWISSVYYNHSNQAVADELYYTYDSMNRVSVSQGTLFNGVVQLGSRGVLLSYDAKGQRTSAYGVGPMLSRTTTHWLSGATETTWAQVQDNNTETYFYDGLGRLTTTWNEIQETDVYPEVPQYFTGTNTIVTATHKYDKASRETESVSYKLETADPLAPRRRTSQYDDDGRITLQNTYKYNPSTFLVDLSESDVLYSGGYDAAGLLQSYTVRVYNTATPTPGDIAYVSSNTVGWLKGSSYIEAGIGVTNTPVTTPAPGRGITNRIYNVNDELVAHKDVFDETRSRYFANDASGRAITSVQGQFDGFFGRPTVPQAFTTALSNSGPGGNTTKTQHFFSALDESLGSYGQLPTAVFDVNYTPVSENYPASAPATVLAQEGDTLRIIAARVWGDDGLWYLLAEENGLTNPDEVIIAGIVLRVPTAVVSMSNAAGSFKPFDAREAIGDTTPYQPDPPVPVTRKGCGILGQIIVIAVAVIVSYFATPAAGQAVLGFAAGSTGAAIAGGAIAGAAGAIASQVVGNMIGVYDGFSWTDVALGALSGGVAGGLGAGTGFGKAIQNLKPAAQSAIRAVTASAITQGVAVAVGLQDKFSWRDVAISGASGAASGTATRNMKGFARGMVGSLTGSAVRAALGGRVDTATVIADAFGNALGNSVVEKVTEVRTERFAERQRLEGQMEDFLASYNAEHPNMAEELFPLSDFGLPLDNNPETFWPMITPDEERAGVYSRDLLYRRGIDDPFLQKVGGEASHYYLPAIVGARFVGAVNPTTGRALTAADVEEIIRFSQLPDETRLFDALANGVRFYADEDPFGNRTPEAEIGRVRQQSLHALNGLTVQENIDRYFRIIRENRTDWAVVGAALHGLKDSVYHANIGMGFAAIADFDRMRTYDEPYGHLFGGRRTDYPTRAMAIRVADLVTQAFEIVSGVSSQGYARRTFSPIGLNIAVDLHNVLEAGNVEVFRRTPESEAGFIRAAPGVLPLNIGTLHPELHDLPSSLSLSTRPTWDVLPITWENSVTETQGFLRSDRTTAEQFLRRGIAATNLITNDFIRARAIDMAPLTPLRYGQVSRDVLEERREVMHQRVQELIEQEKRLP